MSTDCLRQVREKRRTSIENRYQLFDSAEECAISALGAFKANKWRWSSLKNGIVGEFVPDHAQILSALIELELYAGESGQNYAFSGRLVYFDGRFGYERTV